MKRPENISQKAQLIKGIGASAWFTITAEEVFYKIERFSPEGVLECSGLFKEDTKKFNINVDYKFTYVSHCKECTIIQNKETFKFFKL